MMRVSENWLSGFFRWLLVTLILAPPALCQVDIRNVNVNTYLALATGASWGASSPGGINNNFIYSPIAADAGVCVYISNNNPTNTHAFTLSLFQTGDPNSHGIYTGNTGRWQSVTSSPAVVFPVTIGTSSTTAVFFKTFASAFVNVQITGSIVQAGVPDTADLYIVQTVQSNCGTTSSGNTVIGPTPNAQAIANTNNNPVIVGGYSNNSQVARTAAVDTASGGWGIGTAFTVLPLNISLGAVSPSSDGNNRALATIGYTLNENGNTLDPINGSRATGVSVSDPTSYVARATNIAWFASSDTVNPAAGAVLLAAVGFTGPPKSYFRQLILSCSAVCDIIVNKISTAGTTCTAVTPKNLQGTAGLATVVNKACTGVPTVVGQMAHFFLAAGGTQIMNIAGYGSVSNNEGVEAVEGAVVAAGTASVGMDGYEK